MYMRIFCISSFPSANDGVSDYTQDLMEALRQQNVELMSGKVDQPFAIFYTRAWSKLLLQIKKFAPDVVHIQYTPTSMGPGLKKGLRRLKKLHIPVVLTVHEKPDFFIDRLPRLLVKPYLLWERSLYQQASSLIVHTQDQYVDVRIRYNIAPEKIHVIPHYIQDTPAQGQTASLRLISLGRIVPKKRLDLVIEALAELRSNYPDLRLVVIGQAPNRYTQYAKNLKQLVQERHLSAQVEWKGYVDEKSLSQILSPHDVAVLPYLMATQSGAAFKVLSHNVPLLTNNLPAFEELISRFSVGLSRPLHSATDIAQAIKEMLQHPEWPAKWQAEIQRLKKEQSLDTIAQLHLTLYANLCQNRSE